MKNIILTCSVLALAACRFTPSTSAAKTPERPNIIFVLSDDHRYDAMGFIGKYPWLQTPNMDRIAAEGAFYKNAFVTIAVCGPSRASFLTGLYPHKHGVSSNEDVRECNWNKTPSFGQYLHDAGYRTGYIGKWHMYHSNQNRPGWDFWATFSGQGKYYNNKITVNGRNVIEKGYVTDVLTRYALEFLNADDDRPFLLYLSHKAVHAPFTPAERHEALYRTEHLPETPNRMYDLTGKPEWQKKHSPGFSVFLNQRLIKAQEKSLKGSPDERHKNDFLNNMRSLKAVDESLGTLMKTLEKTGRLDNTLIIYAGDNGFMFGEHRRGDKRLAYEESLRIPFLMRWPKGIPPGTVIDRPVLNIDLAPTLLEIAGCAESEPAMDGSSLRPLFKNKDVPWRTGFLYTYFRDLQAIIPTMVGYRNDRYMLVESLFRKGDIQELYALKQDPYELNNLYDHPEYATIQNDLQQTMEQEKIRLNYRADIPDPNPKRFETPEYGVVFNYAETREGNQHGTAFTRESRVEFPPNPDANFADPVFQIHMKLTAESDGSVTSQGSGVMGAITAVTGGKFRFILLRGSKKYPPERRYILESKKPILNQSCEVIAEYDDNLKIARLILNGEQQAEAHIANAFGTGLGDKGTITVGRLLPKFSDERERIDLTGDSFTGKLQKLVVERLPSHAE